MVSEFRKHCRIYVLFNKIFIALGIIMQAEKETIILRITSQKSERISSKWVSYPYLTKNIIWPSQTFLLQVWTFVWHELDTFVWLSHFWDILLIFVGVAGSAEPAYKYWKKFHQIILFYDNFLFLQLSICLVNFTLVLWSRKYYEKNTKEWRKKINQFFNLYFYWKIILWNDVRKIKTQNRISVFRVLRKIKAPFTNLGESV